MNYQLRLAESDVRVRLRDRGGHSATGILSRLDNRTLSIDVPGVAPAIFLNGCPVHLDLSMMDLSETIRTRGTLRHRSVGRGRRIYDVTLGESEELVPFVVRSILDRRDAVRFVADQSMFVRIKPGDESCDVFPEILAPVTDLSANGLGIRVPFPHDRNLAVGDTVEVAIALPGQSERTTVRARVFHSRAAGAHAFMGLGFIDRPQSARLVTDAEAPAPRRVIAGYVESLKLAS